MDKTEKSKHIRHFRRHQHIARAGDRLETIYRLEDGWACRYKLLSKARRQITALFLPGDFCEPQWLLGEQASNPILALTALRASCLAFSEIFATDRNDTKTLLAAMLSTLDRQSEWIVTLGRKTATERLCALLIDIYERMLSNRRTSGEFCPLPLTQTDLADIVGLTPVHVNRVLKQLRADGLIELRDRSLRIPAPDRLRLVGAAL